jgi:hypothetical protein
MTGFGKPSLVDPAHLSGRPGTYGGSNLIHANRRKLVSSYRISLVPEAAADDARRSRRSPGYGHPVHEDTATGYGPCRECLRFFEVGRDRRLLLTYDAFQGIDSHPLPGPIYIHADECDRYPEDGGVPEWLFENPLTLLAFRFGREPVGQVHIEAGGNDEALKELLSRPEVDYVQIRDRGAGCFAFNVLGRENMPGTMKTPPASRSPGEADG